MSETTPGFSGSIPKNYDERLGPLIFIDYARDLVERLAKEKIQSVLETAAGTGIVTAELRRVLGDAVKIVATDINEEMLAVARGKFASDSNLELSIADACELPFADDSFDALVCQFGIMFFPDKVQALREARRVLKPGGVFVANVWDSLATSDFVQAANDSLAESFPDDPPTFYDVPFGWNDPAVIRETFAEAGFANCEIETLTKDCECDSVEEATFALIDSSPMSIELDSMEGVDLPTVRARIKGELAKRFGDPPIGAKMQALVITARS